MLYFLDTEFNGMGGDLISLALTSEDGRHELYLAAPCLSPEPWVAENVIPIISCPGAMPTTLHRSSSNFGWSISNFFRGALDHAPIVTADWPDDIAYFCKALIIGPGQMVDIKALCFDMIRVDAYPTDLPGAVQHNALWDARALRRKIIG